MKTSILIPFAEVSNMVHLQIKRNKVLHFSASMLVGGITAFVSERAGISDNKFQTLILSESEISNNQGKGCAGRLAILILAVAFGIMNTSYCFGQAPYAFVTNVDPGWVSSNPSNKTLSYQPTVGHVKTSGWNSGIFLPYNNSQITSYTSPVMNFTSSCGTSPLVNITVSLNLRLQPGADWLYFEYEIFGTWITPVTMSTLPNSSGINLSAFQPFTVANINNNRNGWTGNLGPVTFNYIAPKDITRFRFIFASDAIINTTGITPYTATIIDFKVDCIVALPLEIAEFSGRKTDSGNLLEWQVENEVGGDYYLIEKRQQDGTWTILETIYCQGLNHYSIGDTNPESVINYYRMTQVDNNGQAYVHDESIVSIDNLTTSNLRELKYYNMMGQEVDPYEPGLVIMKYEDGSSIKKYNYSK